MDRRAAKADPKHNHDMHELAGALTDFRLAPKSLKVVTAGLEAGADCMEEVKKRGRGHAGSTVHARGSGVRGGPHGRGGGSVLRRSRGRYRDPQRVRQDA